jgi:drug/metabolite transporter (DMT)-like permease
MQPARVNEGRIGLLVLGQVPTVQDLLGFALVIAGVALHQDREQGGAGRDRQSAGARRAVR